MPLIKRLGLAVATLAVTSSSLLLTAPAAEAGATGIYKNCTALNGKWSHGVGRANAKDKTSGKPVTNFFHSTKQYNKAMNNNKGLDRDKDGIACEKR